MAEHAPRRRTLAAVAALTAATLVVAAALVAAGCGEPGKAAPTPAAAPPPGVLTVGSVSLTPAREFAIFRPFVDYLASQLHDAGIGHGEVVLVDSVAEMADRLQDGAVDLYFDSPVPVATACRLSGAVPLLRRWKQGVVEYHGVLVARRDSGIRAPADLRGRMVAFSEPFSTSGYLLPKATLIASGLSLQAYEDPAADVPPDEIGYVLSGDAENTIVWVLKGKVAAGALNADYLDVLAGERRGELGVIMTTIDVPRNVVCVRADLPPEITSAVERALTAMNGSEAGRHALAAFQGTTRFDRFPTGAKRALEPLNELLQVLTPADQESQ